MLFLIDSYIGKILISDKVLVVSVYFQKSFILFFRNIKLFVNYILILVLNLIVHNI